MGLQSQIVAEVQQGSRPDTLLLLEHEKVITLGRGWRPENLLRSIDWLRASGIDVHEAPRGGDVTYHGPGQLIGYPIISLKNRGQDLHRYLRDLEAVIIRALRPFGLEAASGDDPTGVWVDGRKIASIGIRVERWVTSHGFALNVNTDLEAFDLIVACGLKGRKTTSIARETGQEHDLDRVAREVAEAFASVFGAQIRERPPEELLQTATSLNSTSRGRESDGE